MPSPTDHSAPRTLSTADARREDVLEAAATIFAARGFYGTPTTAVAKAAGISHAYLFRLFPTKADLVIAVVGRCNERIHVTFTAAAAQAKVTGEPALEAMGRAYHELLEDRELLIMQLHAHAACPDIPAIRDAMRDGFKRLVELVERESGATAEDVQRFFARGMLLNVLAAVDADEVNERWAQILAAPSTYDC